MLRPIDGAPTSSAPRLPASITPGPPPVTTTIRGNRRRPNAASRAGRICAPPRNICCWPRGSSSASRSCAAQASPPGSGRRAPPNRITVERMPRSARIISGFSSSSCSRTGAQFAPRHEIRVVPGQPVGRRRASAACPARSWPAPDPRPNAAAASSPPFPSDSCRSYPSNSSDSRRPMAHARLTPLQALT